MEIIRWGLGAVLLLSGLGHFAASPYFINLVPAWVPSPKRVVQVSGIADIAVGTLVVLPATTALGGWLAAALISAYLVVHLDAARHTDPRGPLQLRPIGVAARLAVNVGYIAAAVLVATTA